MDNAIKKLIEKLMNHIIADLATESKYEQIRHTDKIYPVHSIARFHDLELAIKGHVIIICDHARATVKDQWIVTKSDEIPAILRQGETKFRQRIRDLYQVDYGSPIPFTFESYYLQCDEEWRKLCTQFLHQIFVHETHTAKEVFTRLLKAYKKADIFTTQQLEEAFMVQGFRSPCISVIRKRDGKAGYIFFVDSPRFYFGFEERYPIPLLVEAIFKRMDEEEEEE